MNIAKEYVLVVLLLALLFVFYRNIFVTRLRMGPIRFLYSLTDPVIDSDRLTYMLKRQIYKVAQMRFMEESERDLSSFDKSLYDKNIAFLEEKVFEQRVGNKDISELKLYFRGQVNAGTVDTFYIRQVLKDSKQPLTLSLSQLQKSDSVLIELNSAEQDAIRKFTSIHIKKAEKQLNKLGEKLFADEIMSSFLEDEIDWHKKIRDKVMTNNFTGRDFREMLIYCISAL